MPRRRDQLAEIADRVLVKCLPAGLRDSIRQGVAASLTDAEIKRAAAAGGAGPLLLLAVEAMIEQARSERSN